MAIPVMEGLVLRLETDAGLTSDLDRVTSWADSSGFGHHLVAQGDPSIIAALTPSGAPAIAFDGEQDLLERTLTAGALPIGNTDRTLFFVVNYIAQNGVASGVAYGDKSHNETFGLVADRRDSDLTLQGYGAGDKDSNVPAAGQGWIVQSAVLDNDQYAHFLNGTLIDNGSHVFATDPKRLVIGAEIGGLGESQLEVAAVLMYDRALSAAEMAEVEGYLQGKYITEDDSGANRAPVSIGEHITLTYGAVTEIDLLANDIDDQPLTGAMITILEGPQFGTLGAPDPVTGQITYTHDGGTAVHDSFTYMLTDASGAVSNPATVAISVGVEEYSLDGFVNEVVLTRADINSDSPFFQPISMTFLPDNRMLLLSKDGIIQIVDPETGANSQYMKINNIDTGQERGLLDITLDPDFANNGYFYVYYTPNQPKNAQIARFQHQENAGGLTSTGNLASEFTVWQDTDGYLACCHYGGGLDFGPDGKIWLTTSDKFQATTPGEGTSGGSDNMLDLASSSGKVIRVNADGTVPDGSDGTPANPWADPDDGFDDFVWAYGLRNPFRARWDIEYGYMYMGEVGGNQQLIAHDDIHLASLDQPGVFYGWPFYEGVPNTYVNGGQSQHDPNNYPLPDNDLGDPANGDYYSAPIFSLPHDGNSTSITGGMVYRGDMFPDEWQGVYFYGDYTNDFIRYLVLDATGTQVLGDYAFRPSAQIPGTTNEVVAIEVGPDGALYYTMIASGEIHRIVFTDGNKAPEIVTATLTPLAGDSPLDVVFTAYVTDAEGDALMFTLNLGDGTIISDVVGSDGLISVNHTYQVDGRYNVSLTVSDPTHNVFALPIQVEVGDVNYAPEISGAGPDLSVVAVDDAEVTFTAHVSDADGDEMTYIWHFGDGESATGTVDGDGNVTVTHSYTAEGAYHAYLEVTDGVETTFSANFPIQVGAATEVPITNGLVLLLQSDIKIGLGEGSTVTAWLDGSGNGNNLFGQGDPQLLPGQTPTGQSAIVFDGVGDLLARVDSEHTLFSLPEGNADRTIFFVVDYIATNNVSAGVAYGDAAQNEAFGLVTVKGDHLGVQGYGKNNDFTSAVNGVSPGYIVQSAVLADSVLRHFLDGELIGTRTQVFNTDVEKLVLGAEIGAMGEAEMGIAAVLIYDRALSDVERAQVEAFLQEKYITGSDDNTAPVAADDSLMFTEDVALAGNVLDDNGNGPDHDPDGDPLTVALVQGVSHGQLVLNPDGSFIYTPDADFDGVDGFTYRISDGRGGTDLASVTLTGIPVDDPAVANDDSYATGVDTALIITADLGVLANDFDAEGDPFTATLIGDVANGTLALNADGSFTYTPDAGFTGQDSFTYALTGGDTATVTITVGTPPAPVIPVTGGLVAAYEADQNVALAAGNVVAGWLDGSGRGNDLVAQGDPRFLAGATPTGQSAVAFDGVEDLLERVNTTDTLNGLPGGSADRTIFFVVNYLDPEGVAAGVAYGDGAANETFGLVTGGNQNLQLQGWGKKNDHGTGISTLTDGWIVQSVVLSNNAFNHYLNGDLIGSGSHVFNTDLQRLVLGAEIAGMGEAQLQIGAVLIYDRALNTTERVQVEDYLQGKYIVPPDTDNTPPLAMDDSFIFTEDVPLMGNVLADNGYGADIDPDGDPLSVSLLDTVGFGDLVLNADGSFTYTPDADFDGTDGFTYQISDGRGGTDTASVTLQGIAVNDPAVANNDSYATAADSALIIAAAEGVLANDTDAEGDPFTASLISDVANGMLSLNADGSFTYTPDTGFIGYDSFVYAVTGGDTATVTLAVGVEQTIPVPQGLVAAYQISEGLILGAGGVVVGWEDGSGLGNHLAAQGDPTLLAGATPTGADAIAFDGMGDMLTRMGASDPITGLATGGEDRSMFFVVNYLDGQGVSAGLAYGDGAQNEAFGLVSGWKDQDLVVQGWGNRFDHDSNAHAPAQGWMVQSVVLDDNFFSHYLNGGLIDSGAHGFNTDLQKLIIGGEIAGAGVAKLEVAAAFIYDRALSEGERLDMEAWLQQLYIDHDFALA